jgi:hypothetical protein
MKLGSISAAVDAMVLGPIDGDALLIGYVATRNAEVVEKN